MAVKIVVPGFGESITEGTIAQWLKKEGDFVKKDESILEIESEKATQPIPSPATGTLHITAKEGDRVAIGSVIGTIDETAKAPAASAPAAPPPANQAESRSAAPVAAPAVPAAPAAKETLLSPAARRLAVESGVDASKVPATGRHGVVLKENVQDALAPSKSPAQPIVPETPAAIASSDREKRVPMSAIRQRIADRLLNSQKASASLTTFNELDMTAIMELRTRYKDKFKEKHSVNLGFMSFFVKACVEALKAYPLVNASIDGRDIVHHYYYNLGVAVSTEKGLMVPVLRDADKMTFAQIEKAIGDLAVKARDGKISINDLQGGTFTITNGGIFGSMMSTPILNFPQAAILGMHSIQKRAVVRDDAIVIRPMMYLALTYDHRLIDGRDAVLFLVRVKECLEDPQRLLLEI